MLVRGAGSAFRGPLVRSALARSLDRALLVILGAGLVLVGVGAALLPWRGAWGIPYVQENSTQIA